MRPPCDQDTGIGPAAEYDPRYLAGVELFNRREYFEAHEVWEDLWHETASPDRRYVQGLIQAAVAVYHAGNGNARGARRLVRSGRRYMAGFETPHLGLDAAAFWATLERALADFLPDPPAAEPRVREVLLPTITLT